jgi:serine/threonine-protein kinase
VDAESVAEEIHLGTPGDLPALLRANRTLRDLGLGPLLQGGSMPRAVWESTNRVSSPMQRAARELDLGNPYTKM